MKKIIEKSLKYGTLLCTYGFVLSVLIQIFARFFLSNAPSWTEEASRIFFIYAISFASGLAFKSNYYVALELLHDHLPEKWKRIVSSFTQILVILLFLIVAIYSIQLIRMGHIERSPSLRINMSYAFFSIFVMSSTLCFYTLLQFTQQTRTAP